VGRNTESCEYVHLAEESIVRSSGREKNPKKFEWEMKPECSIGMGINHTVENTKGSAGFSPSLDVSDEDKLFFCKRWRDIYWSNISNWPRFRHN